MEKKTLLSIEFEKVKRFINQVCCLWLFQLFDINITKYNFHNLIIYMRVPRQVSLRDVTL